MRHETGQFNGSGNTPLFYQSWHPEGEARAVLLIVHGIGEHSGRYANIVGSMITRRIAVYGFDHRGHGRSPGKRGHIDSFAELREDVRAMVTLILAREAPRPLLLMGQSLGGLIVLNYALHYPDELAGVCAMAPQLGEPQIARALIAMSQILSRVWPSLTVETGLDVTALSRNEQVVTNYKEDPLVHTRGSMRAGAEVIEATQWTQDHPAEFQPPLLLIHGDADRITDPDGTRAFYDKLTIADKHLLIYEGGYHEAHNDIHRERVLADIGQWCDMRILVATQNEPE